MTMAKHAIVSLLETEASYRELVAEQLLQNHDALIEAWSKGYDTAVEEAFIFEGIFGATISYRSEKDNPYEDHS